VTQGRAVLKNKARKQKIVFLFGDLPKKAMKMPSTSYGIAEGGVQKHVF
jgi:hypothetical protein